MDYSLNVHPRQYNILARDVGLSLITGLSGVPYALRHLDLAKKVKSHALGHRVIAYIEMIPILGGLAAIIERIVAKVFFENKKLSSPKEENHSSSGISSDIAIEDPENLLEGLLTPQANKVLDYLHMTVEELQIQHKNNLDQIQKAYDQSVSLRNSKTSIAYSEEVAKVEHSVAVLEQIQGVLQEKNVNIDNTSLVDARAILQTMYKNMPAGESIPLNLDVMLLQRFSRVPTEKTYTCPLGTFENPTISPSKLSSWFRRAIISGKYEGPGCSFIIDEIDGGVKSERKNAMFTIVRLNKRKDQVQKEMKAKKNTQPSSFNKISKYINGFFKGKEDVSKDSESAIEVKKQSHSISTSFDWFSKKVNYAEVQKKVLEDLERDLPAMMDVWNFDGFEIWSTEKLLQYNPALKWAYKADRIVFYHKKVKGPESEDQELSDVMIEEEPKIIELTN